MVWISRALLVEVGPKFDLEFSWWFSKGMKGRSGGVCYAALKE